MKTIKNNLYLLLFVFAFAACESDPTGTEGTVTETSGVTINFTDMNNDMTLLEDGGTVTFDVALSQALPMDGIVTFGVTSSDGSLETTLGVTEVMYDATAVVTAGSTTASVTLTFSDDTLADVSEGYEITVANFEFAETQNEYYILSGGDLVRNVTVFDVLPIVVETTEADVSFVFTWVGSSDLDCRIVNSSGTTTDTGYTVSPGEEVFIMQADADDVYTFSIRPWSVPATPSSIDYTVEFTSPAGTETFTGTLIDATGFWSMEVPVLEITKTTSSPDVTYLLTQL